MDVSAIVSFLQETAYLLIVLVSFLFFALRHGRQTVTNIILGLYLALLISIEFPFYDTILGSTSSAATESIVKIILFAGFTVVTTLLFIRILPREYSEKSFEALWKKTLLAVAGTILIMSFSYHVLPVTDFIHPGSPINYLFGSGDSFFYWLLVPLVILFIV